MADSLLVLKDAIIGIVAGLVSGFLVSLFFYWKEKKRDYLAGKEDSLKQWIFYLTSLNDEISFEYGENPVRNKRILRLLNQRMELYLRTSQYSQKEYLLALQDDLLCVEEAVETEPVDVVSIDEHLKEAIKKVAKAFSTSK